MEIIVKIAWNSFGETSWMCKSHFVSWTKILRTLDFMFHNKVNVWIEAPSWSLPTYCRCTSRAAFSPPASKACNGLVFLRSQIQLAAVGFYELLESISLSSRLRTCKQYIFLLSSRNVSSVLLCKKPIHKSLPEQEQSHSALPVLWLCTRYNSVTEALLWLPRYKFWAQHKWQQWS